MKTSKLIMGFIGLFSFCIVIPVAGTPFKQMNKILPKSSTAMNQDIDDGIPSASMDPKSKTIAYNIDSIEKKQVESYSRKDCVGECDCTYYPFSKVWVCRGCCTEEDLIWLP